LQAIITSWKNQITYSRRNHKPHKFRKGALEGSLLRQVRGIQVSWHRFYISTGWRPITYWKGLDGIVQEQQNQSIKMAWKLSRHKSHINFMVHHKT